MDVDPCGCRQSKTDAMKSSLISEIYIEDPQKFSSLLQWTKSQHVGLSCNLIMYTAEPR